MEQAIMKGVIIVNGSMNVSSNKVTRLLEEAKNLNIGLEVVPSFGQLAKIENNDIVLDRRISDADFVIYQDKDLYLATMIDKMGIPLFSDHIFMRLCDDKMLTNIELANLGFRMPKTVSSPLVFTDKPNLQFLDHLTSELSFPMVGKENFSSLGMGVYLLHNFDELKDFYMARFSKPLQFQEYIASSYGRSIRVLALDGKILGSIERYNDNDFRSNYKNHGSAKKIELSEKYRLFAMKIIEKLKINYAGIDILYGENDEPVLCEINSNAFFEEFEHATGINVAKEYLEMILRKLR